MRKKILIIESIIFFFVFLELISPTALVHGGSSWSQTSDIDFNGNGAYFTNVTIVGTGIDAQIELAKTDGDWKQKSPPYKPSARCFRAMATIHNDDKVLLFGGFNGTALDDTWVYDLSENEWVERAIFCLTKPSARYWHAMAGIYNDNKVVLFGGYPLLDDTWVYDLSDDSWEQKFPSNKPSARDVHVMATIYNDDKVLLFGGYNETTSTSLGDTWVYDLSDNQWYNKTPSNSPSARSGHAMATIYNDDKVVLFGGTGVGAGAGIKDDTWIYDLGDNNWVEKSQTTKPTPRISHQMATIHNDDKVLLFGGYDGTTRKNDTWVYDLRNENWTRKLPSNKPSARFGSEMAGIYNEDKVVLFGGNDSALKDDTWLYELVVYPSSGEFLSPYKDLGGKSNFLSITWNATIQTGTSLKFQIRTAATQSNLSSKNFVGPDGVTDTYYTKSGTKIWSGHNGDSFLQYKIYFNTTDTDQTPVLKDVKIMYNILPDPPTLISPENNIWINNSKPKFTWKFNDNDSLSQSGYQLQLDDNYDFSSIDYDSGEVSSENTSYIPQTKIADGTWYWRVKTKDSDNDWGDYSKDVWTVKIDTMPPITNHTILGKIGENGWYISDVQLTLLPLDIMSGVAETKYQVDNSEWKVYTAPFNVSGDGEHTMSYYSKDHAGNEEIKKNITIKIDTTAPYLNILEPKNGTITNKKEIYINGTTEKDAKIKINGLDVNLVDNKFRYKIELTEEGENIIEILAIDDAGNEKLMRIYIILKPELSTLNGKVKDSVSNAYIEGVGVSIFYSNGTLAKQTLTNQNGEYSFLNLEKGTYYISADKEGYNPYQAKMLVLFSGINYFNFTIQPKEGSLSLTIVDSNGNFVSDAKVKVMQNSNLIWEGKSDKKGKVAPNLQPGNYKVSIEKEGYIPYETNVTISPGKDFSLQPTLLIKKKKAEEFPLIYLIIIISIACVCAGIAGGIKLSKSKKEEKPEEHIGIPGIGVGKEITPTAPPTIMEGVKEIKCIVCSGTIKSGSPIARCHWCNIPFHQSCANRLVECPKCKRVV